MGRPRHEVNVVNAHGRVRMRRAPIIDAVHRVLVAEKVEGGAVTLILVDDDELLELNRAYLGHDYYTDVITFSLERKPLEGEIYISVDRAREQAADVGVRLGDEILRLAIHGTLHLAGYDDITDAQRRHMTTLEDRYLGH